MKCTKLLLLLAGLPNAAFAQGSQIPQGQTLDGDKVVSSSAGSKESKTLPGDQVLPSVSLGEQDLAAKMEAAKSKLEGMMQGQNSVAPSGTPERTQTSVPTEAKTETMVPASNPPPSAQKTRSKRRARAAKPQQVQAPEADTALASPELTIPQYADLEGVRVYARNIRTQQVQEETITLPGKSLALATLMHGGEATQTQTSGFTRLLLARLDYAFLGPNDAIVEMKGCRVFLNPVGEFQTERVHADILDMTCVAPNGQTLDIPLKGYVIDGHNEYAGLKGTFVADGPMKAMLIKFGANGLEAFGEALKAANTSTQIVAGNSGPAVQGSNVSGNKRDYIAGSVIEKSFGSFLDWWANYYQSLGPRLSIAPGAKLFLATVGTIQVPKIFFGSTISEDQIEIFKKSAEETVQTKSKSRFTTTDKFSGTAIKITGKSDE